MPRLLRYDIYNSSNPLSTLTNVATDLFERFFSLSDEMKPNHAKHMPDLKVRDIFNDVTKQIWSGAEGILVIPVYYRLSYCAYLPDRGGFVGEVSATEYATCERDGYKDILPNGNDCERTANHYVKIVHDDGSLESALIRMQKTKLKKSHFVTLFARG